MRGGPALIMRSGPAIRMTPGGDTKQVIPVVFPVPVISGYRSYTRAASVRLLRRPCARPWVAHHQLISQRLLANLDVREVLGQHQKQYPGPHATPLAAALWPGERPDLTWALLTSFRRHCVLSLPLVMTPPHRRLTLRGSVHPTEPSCGEPGLTPRLFRVREDRSTVADSTRKSRPGGRLDSVSQGRVFPTGKGGPGPGISPGTMLAPLERVFHEPQPRGRPGISPDTMPAHKDHGITLCLACLHQS